MNGTVTLRVSVDELIRISGEFSALVHNLQVHFCAIKNISARTRAYWNGNAGEKGREGFESYQDEIERCIRRLEQHPNDLLRMADVYIQVEKRVADTNRQLQTDHIV